MTQKLSKIRKKIVKNTILSKSIVAISSLKLMAIETWNFHKTLTFGLYRRDKLSKKFLSIWDIFIAIVDFEIFNS